MDPRWMDGEGKKTSTQGDGGCGCGHGNGAERHVSGPLQVMELCRALTELQAVELLRARTAMIKHTSADLLVGGGCAPPRVESR